LHHGQLRGKSQFEADGSSRDAAGDVFSRIIAEREAIHPEWRNIHAEIQSRPDFMELGRLVRELRKPVGPHPYAHAENFPLIDKVSAVREAAGLPLQGTFESRSNANYAKVYLRGTGGDSPSAWISSTASGPSDLFRRTVDHLVVPYARAVASEGYHFSADTFADRFGLDDGQRQYIQQKLTPKLSEDRSNVPIVSGSETLDTGGSSRVADVISKFIRELYAGQK